MGSNRKGVVDRKPIFQNDEKEKLIDELEEDGMTQVKLTKKKRCDRKTIIRATRFDAKKNPTGAYPYAPRATPKFTPRIQAQSVKFVEESPIGKAARGSDKKWGREKKKFGFVDHSPTSQSGTINRSHRPNWKRKSTKKKDGLKPNNRGKKHAAKHQAFTAICWRGKIIEVHSKRRKGVRIRPEYRLEKTKVNTREVVKVIRNKFGPFFKRMGVKYVFTDNDKKLQSKAAAEEWKKFGIKLWPGAGEVWNSAKGGFPVDRPALMPLDQSVHAAWKTHENGLYDRWNSRDERRKTGGGFLNEIENSWEEMPMSKVRAAIDVQRKIHLEILKCAGKCTKYDTD